MDTSTTVSSPEAAEPHHIPLAVRALRRAKPLIVGILRSPVHALLSRDVLLMTYTGRRSARLFTLPLSYVAVGEALYLCTRGPGSSWWRNLRGGADVELVLRGRRVLARATVLNADSAEALVGLRAFVTHNPRTGVMLYKVQRGADGLPRTSDLAREVLASVVVRLTVTGDGK